MTDRTLIAPTRRRAMGKQRRVAIFLVHGGRCGLCTRKIVDGERWEIEHRVALNLGGADEDSNCYPVHQKCHRAKTAEDRKAIAKRNSAVDKGYAGKRKPRGFRAWRKFDGTPVRAEDR